MSSDDEAADSRVVIGISFGNSYSSIACIQGSDAQVIANEEGDRQIPSILAYVDGEEFQGTQAKSQLVRNASNTCAGFRDFIGKDFSQIDPTPAHIAAHPQSQASTVAFSLHDKPVPSEDADQPPPSTVTVSEIATRHIRRLKGSASDYLGKPVTAAVLTVPTSFTEPQRHALVSATEQAGLEVLQIVAEPVAALLAHDRKQASVSTSKPADKTVIVADFGGTRSDVTAISVRGGMYTILATAHDYSLGGAQLDEVVMDHFAKEFLKKHKSAEDPRNHQRSAAKLRLESETVKKALSLGNTAGFNVESLSSGIDFSQTINRTRYELLAGKIFSRFSRLVEECVKKAELDVLDVDEVVLAGGTSHTPRIAQNIRAAFSESTIVVAPSMSGSAGANAVNPSELIARGAALQAELIEGFEREDVELSTRPEVTVTPHLGKCVGVVVSSSDPATKDAKPQENGTSTIQTPSKDIFRPLIPAETPLPVRRTTTFTVDTPSTQSILLRLCEGVRNIKVTKPESTPKTNGEKALQEDEEDQDSEEDEDDEPEETREKEWEVGSVLGELALRDVKKTAKVTLQVSVSAEMEVTVSAMEAGKAGVKGIVQGIGGGAMNGAAK